MKYLPAILFFGGIIIFACVLTIILGRVRRKKMLTNPISNELNEIVNKLTDCSPSYSSIGVTGEIGGGSYAKNFAKDMAITAAATVLSGGRARVHTSDNNTSHLVVFGNRELYILPLKVEKKNKHVVPNYNALLKLDNTNINKIKFRKSLYLTEIYTNQNLLIKFEVRQNFLNLREQSAEQKKYSQFITELQESM